VKNTIELQETRNVLTTQNQDRSGKQTQVLRLKKLLRPQGTLGLFIR